jgi:hypothetical protein
MQSAPGCSIAVTIFKIIGSTYLPLHCSINIILNIRPDDVLRALYHASPFMQQRTLRLSMRKHSYTTHDRLDWIRIDDTFLDTRDEEGRLAAFKVVVEIDEEGEER